MEQQVDLLKKDRNN